MSETVYITWAKSERCWNHYQTVYACIGCNCCATDKKLRYESRLRVMRELLQEQYEFDAWAYGYPEIMALQKRNINANIRYFKKKIRHLKRRLQHYRKKPKGGAK